LITNQYFITVFLARDAAQDSQIKEKRDAAQAGRHATERQLHCNNFFLLYGCIILSWNILHDPQLSVIVTC
jgi:hypothetical protein